VLDSEGEPLRHGVQAEPFIVSPNQEEAEGLVGQEFHDDEDFEHALERIEDMGARNVLITIENGCVALLREDRRRRRFRVSSPRVDPISVVGAGDVLLAAYLAARVAEKPLEEALRVAVAAGAAATLEVGAGRFDPREASRLVGGVEVSELEEAVQRR
jgi:1-phosphofructokinase/tagatose 6-phosphate kinase